MLAVALSLALFGLWLVVGLAVLRATRVPVCPLASLLLAPVTGFAAMLMIVFLVSRAGVPMAVGAGPIAALSALCSGLALWRCRLPDARQLRHYVPYLAVLVMALVLTGRPLFEFGFEWVSYANDDMANYTLAAARIVNHGFFDVPTADQLLTGKDYSLTYWFFNLGVRPGAEMLTAWVSGLTRLSPHQIFMPLILAMHLTLISTASVMALRGRRPRLAAFATAAMLALSALTSLGALYQLIGQVGGLSLLVACAVALLRPFAGLSRADLYRWGALNALFGAALFVMYPEVTPFLGLAWFVYLAIAFVRRRERARALAPVVIVGAVLGALLLNTYALISIKFLTSQTTAGMSHADVETLLFPYFLVPSGLASLWGLQGIASLTGEPWLSTSIAIGGVCLILTGVAAVRGAWRIYPSAIVTLVMLGLGLELFLQRGDFGLFKLAMFVQPFMLPTLAVSILDIAASTWVGIIPLALVGLSSIYGQAGYVERSRGVLGGTGGGLTEIPNASVAAINGEFQQLLARTTNGQNFLVDTSNVVLAKFQALYLIGRPSTFATQDFFYNIANADPGYQLFIPNIQHAADELRSARIKRFASYAFDLADPSQPGLNDPFTLDSVGQPPAIDPATTTVIYTSGLQTIVNRWPQDQATTADFVATPWHDVHNHLLFISSFLGQPYYTPDRRHVALYQLEPDLFYDGQSMSGLGRYFLFEVINPSPRLRIVLDITDSLASDGVNQLPHPTVIGEDRQPIPFVGRGSGRMFSGPVTPRYIDGKPYVVIDMGTDGQTFPSRRTGLMGMYGSDIPIDRRRIVGFGRDISAISDDQFNALHPGSGVSLSADALRNRQLAYSGIYEDGWISDTAFVQLEQPDDSRTLVFRGSVPAQGAGDQTTRLSVSLDGQVLAERDLSPGAFDVRVPVAAGHGLRGIGIHFSRTITLGAPDNRPAAAQVRSLAFDSAPAVGSGTESGVDIVDADSALALADKWGPFESWQGQSFRWVDTDASLIVQRTGCLLTLDVAPGPSAPESPLIVSAVGANDATLASVQLSGREQVTFDAPMPSGAIRLHVQSSGSAVAGDGRTLNFRVFHATCGGPQHDDPASLRMYNQAGDIIADGAYAKLVDGVLPTDSVLLGSGWYTVESAAGETFRWVGHEAELVVTQAVSDTRAVELDVEPGPGVATGPLSVEVADPDGRPIGSFSLSSRQTVHLDLPTRAGQTTVFRMRVMNGGAPTPNDPRTLNFRVFSVQ